MRIPVLPDVRLAVPGHQAENNVSESIDSSSTNGPHLNALSVTIVADTNSAIAAVFVSWLVVHYRSAGGEFDRATGVEFCSHPLPAALHPRVDTGH